MSTHNNDRDKEETVAVYIQAYGLKNMPMPRLPNPKDLYKKFIAQFLANRSPKVDPNHPTP